MGQIASFQIKGKTSAQAVCDSLSQHLGFKTAKRSVNIRIQFAPGIGHTSWTSPKSSIGDVAELAELLITGYRTFTKKKTGTKVYTKVRPRPIFDNYASLYADDMRQICINAFQTYSHWSVAKRALQAGKAIIKDIQHKAYNGSLSLAMNTGKYAARKASVYGNVPFVATKALMKGLEVIIE